MTRKAFVMYLNSGAEAEYERRHNPIWAELEQVLIEHGVQRYSIFLHPDKRQLFGYVECENEAEWQSIADTEVCRRWWAYMRDIMATNPDNSPVSTELREVFHIEATSAKGPDR
ncbi:MAG: L-rhamnose mutarotase [Verrucomicrobia bacterium]|nr:L-rhamnose mutarotase [Verrucomicrobiota bacterium]